MFSNLLAEMARNQYTGKDMSRAVGMEYGSWRNKMVGRTEFTRSEMLKIRNKVFPDMTLDYLFASNNDGKVAQ